MLVRSFSSASLSLEADDEADYAAQRVQREFTLLMEQEETEKAMEQKESEEETESGKGSEETEADDAETQVETEEAMDQGEWQEALETETYLGITFTPFKSSKRKKSGVFTEEKKSRTAAADHDCEAAQKEMEIEKMKKEDMRDVEFLVQESQSIFTKKFLTQYGRRHHQW